MSLSFRGYGGYGPDFGLPAAEGLVGFLLAFGALLVFILIIVIAINVLCYVFTALGLYSLSERRGMSNPGLSWIPFVGVFRAGSIADDINLRAGRRTHYGMIILIGNLVSFVVSSVSSSISAANAVRSFGSWDDGGWAYAPYGFAGSVLSSLSWLVGIATYVFLIISLHSIYKTYRPQSATAWTVLSAIPVLHFLSGFFLFALRNAEPQAWDTRGYYGPGHDGDQTYQRPPEWPEPPRAPEPQEWRHAPPPEFQPWDDSAPR